MKMSGCMRMRLLVVCMAMTVNTGAHAICAINAGGLSLTPTAASTGTFTPPNAPVAQAVTFTITGTFNAIFGGTCRVALAFNRASAPIAMARVGGGATMPYTVTSLPGGGNTVIFTGGGAPGAAERLQFNFAAPGGFQFGIPFTATLTGYFLAQPGSPQRAGSYSDAIEARLYSVNDAGNAALRSTQGFTVTGNVGLACTIAGAVTGAPDNATIPVSALGTVTTAPIVRSFANVECNSLSALQLVSQNGAVRRVTAAPGGFTNIIDYAATASFGGASSTVNTATVPGAAGPESGSIGTTGSATPTGTLQVTITPSAPALPLVQGSYADILRVTVTAQ